MRTSTGIIIVLTVCVLPFLPLLFSDGKEEDEGPLKRAKDHQIKGFTKCDEGTWNGPYFFVFGTDPQPGFMDRLKGGRGTRWEEEIRLLKEGLSAMDQMTIKPRFFFVGGDIVDALPGEEPTKTHQTNDMISAFSESPVPVMVICGNHDTSNDPTNKTIREFTDIYGDDYYTFYVGGVMYIALNAMNFYNPSQIQELANEQMLWLQKQLQLAKDNQEIRHVVVFMHIPLFLSSADEEDSKFAIPTNVRKVLLDMFADVGISFVFSGHYHRIGGGTWVKTVDAKDIKVQSVVVSAVGAQLGVDKSGMTIVKVYEDRIMQHYYPMDHLPRDVIL